MTRHYSAEDSERDEAMPLWTQHAQHTDTMAACHLCTQHDKDLREGRCILHGKKACPACAYLRRNNALADELLAPARMNTPKPTMWRTLRCQAGQIILDNAHDYGVVLLCEAPGEGGEIDTATLCLTASQAINLAQALLEAVTDELVDPTDTQPANEEEVNE